MMQADRRPLVGRVALVTGASSGLGRATAIGLAQAGADVVLMARTEVDLAETARSVEAAGRQALAIPIELSDSKSILDAVGTAASRFGRIDVVVNAAATDAPAPAADLSIDAWDRVLAVNLRAPFVLAKGVFPHMRRLGGGTIVNVSSVAGKRGWANASAYCASKFGLTGLTQSLAAEGKPYGIRVCIVYPGGMATHWGVWSAAERQTAATPTDRSVALPPDDVASLIVWIATAPREVVLNEAIVTPIAEQGWP